MAFGSGGVAPRAETSSNQHLADVPTRDAHAAGRPQFLKAYLPSLTLECS